MNVPLTRPRTGEPEELNAARIIRSGWLTQGPEVAAFEHSVTAFTTADHGVAASNCTAALHLALIAHGIGPGDEVIVPSYTWIATPNSVRMVGANPVFADIDPVTLNVTAETMAAVMTDKTRALMPVDQFGMPCDMDGISDLAQANDLVVIDDAACALGSLYKGKPVGNGSVTACFSFHPRKLITTGEGGMLMTDNEAIAERARMLASHGASIPDTAKHTGGVEMMLSEEFTELGYNYRLSNIQGAVGVEQMKRLEEMLTERKHLAKRYDDALSGVPGLQLPQEPDGCESNWQTYAVRIADDHPASRDEVAGLLLEHGVASRPGYMMCHTQPMYGGPSAHGSLPATEQVFGSLVIIPLFCGMSDAEQEHVVETLTQAFKR